MLEEAALSPLIVSGGMASRKESWDNLSLPVGFVGSQAISTDPAANCWGLAECVLAVSASTSALRFSLVEIDGPDGMLVSPGFGPDAIESTATTTPDDMAADVVKDFVDAFRRPLQQPLVTSPSRLRVTKVIDSDADDDFVPKHRWSRNQKLRRKRL